MLMLPQYKKILFFYSQDYSISKIAKLTGHSRITIRKVLRIKKPQPFKTPQRPSKLDDYKEYIEVKYPLGSFVGDNQKCPTLDNYYCPTLII